jgi:DNA-binding transcriptional MerR regulator
MKPKDTTNYHIPIHRAAKQLGVTAATIRNWEARGQIDCIRINGRRYLAVADIDRLLARTPETAKGEQ